jgi:hypothetical protein
MNARFACASVRDRVTATTCRTFPLSITRSSTLSSFQVQRLDAQGPVTKLAIWQRLVGGDLRRAAGLIPGSGNLLPWSKYRG